ncbi:MAG: hypothetical protein FH755_00535 [Methylophaga sp.]|nr:hypothetical protein [Methylophaga sp.]
MKMKKQVLAGMVAAATMGFFIPLTSHAFGLGKIDVMSALNEPFRAEIGLTALRPEEKDNLQIKMASDAEFTKAGLSRSMLLDQMQFDIIESGGRNKILITSKQPIKEPFLDFLISATAGAGIMIREYTVLLDPPEYVTAASRGSNRTAESKPAAPVQEPSTTRYQYAQSRGFNGSSYDVKRSDTLWNVALETRPDSNVSVHQMMMALLNANPDAFTNQNVNGLKAGVTLQIPSRDEILAMSSPAARAAFAAQNEAWKNRNRQPTQTAAITTRTTTEPEQAQETATADPETQDTTDTATAADTPDPATAAGSTDTESAEARLQLVAPEDADTSEDDASPNVAGNEDIKQLTEQLTLAQETIEAQAQENIDFKERMDAMEEQLETMRRLISLKDADLARLQSMLEEEDPALAAQAAAVVESEAGGATADAQAIDTAATDPLPDAEPQTAATGTDNTAETASQQPAPTGANNDIISNTAEALNLDAAQVQSTLDQVKQFVNDNKLPTALGLLLLLLLLWLLARRSRREVTWDEAVQKMDKASEKQAGKSTVVAPVNDDDMTDAPLSEQEHEQEKSVSELVEQADMFVGYADYVQARSSLEQARSMEPANSLVAYKLLFVLYKQQQTDEFIALVEEVPFETDSFEWAEIKQWGKVLAPNHSLFAEQQAAPAKAEDSDTEALTVSETVTESAQAEPDTEVEAEVETQDSNHIEFDLNDFADTEVQTEPEEEVSSNKKQAEDVDDDLLTFDTNLGLDDKIQTTEDKDNTPLELDITEDDERDETLSFDQNIESDSSEPEDTDALLNEAEFVETNDEEPDLEFDIDDLDEIDEAETKLDLAAAYIDMGDPDGARSILNEVLLEGNDEQKNRAHDLLNSLS